ncbi:SigB/SigF/SigG family RNA polymerase sigma factor [Solirubrobacter soli]|uniref:SigB/SigF/SigG family RNA polymerase sigma factor n=1 Tax=Solirubrobacter soli TaxID=363832 RepID=UPI00069F5E36|nr:SigB/SigF/SigG family RNA polymerase sigma factor [Solirubrobacter soli]
MTELSNAEVARVFERYARERRPQDRETLVLRFLPLARHLARKYATQNEREDLEQVACEALLKALDRFDPSRGRAFTSYAVPTILGELKRHFRDRGWAVKVPRSLQEMATRVATAAGELSSELGRSPTTDEIATRCDITVEQVLEVFASRSAHRPESLDRPVNDEEHTSVLELLPDEEAGFDRVERATDLSRLMASLHPRERLVLRLRFEADLVQRDIAELLGISQMHVSRLIRQAIAALQEAAEQPVRQA